MKGDWIEITPETYPPFDKEVELVCAKGPKETRISVFGYLKSIDGQGLHFRSMDGDYDLRDVTHYAEKRELPPRRQRRGKS